MDRRSLEIDADRLDRFFEGSDDVGITRIAILKMVDNRDWLGPRSDEVGESLAENPNRSPIRVKVGLFAIAIGRYCQCSAVRKSKDGAICLSRSDDCS